MLHTHTSGEFWNTWVSSSDRSIRCFWETTPHKKPAQPTLPKADALHTTLCQHRKKKSGKTRKPLCLIFIKAHDKRTHVTSRQTFIVSEAIPFGPQTHHTLRRGFSAACRQAEAAPSQWHPQSPGHGFVLWQAQLEAELQLWILLALQTCLSLATFTSSQPHHNNVTHPIQHLLGHSGSFCPALYLNLALVYSSFSARSLCGQKQGTCGFLPPHHQDPTAQG